MSLMNHDSATSTATAKWSLPPPLSSTKRFRDDLSCSSSFEFVDENALANESSFEHIPINPSEFQQREDPPPKILKKWSETPELKEDYDPAQCKCVHQPQMDEDCIIIPIDTDTDTIDSHRPTLRATCDGTTTRGNTSEGGKRKRADSEKAKASSLYLFYSSRSLPSFFNYHDKLSKMVLEFKSQQQLSPPSNNSWVLINNSQKTQEVVNDETINATHENDSLPECILQRWRLTDLNINYWLCPSLSDILFVPGSINDEQLKCASKFRNHNRLPILTYLHYNNSSLVRSGQPQIGYFSSLIPQNFTNTDEAKMDDLILQALADSGMVHDVMSNYENGQVIPSSEPPAVLNDCKLIIVDLRSRLARNGQGVFFGGGTEQWRHASKQGEGWRFEFFSLANIHAVRSSFEGLKDLWNESTEVEDLVVPTNLTGNKKKLVGYKEMPSQLQACGWLEQLCEILCAVNFVARAIINYPNVSVIVHCTDGWDRTSQVCFLGQICCNAYFRTRRGFVELFEKDFLACGHPFKSRFTSEKDASPVFLQTLDCVRVLVEQFPTLFEFTSDFLLAFYKLVVVSPFVYNYNNEMERVWSSTIFKSLEQWKTEVQKLTEDKSYHSFQFQEEVREIPQFHYRLHLEVRVWSAYFKYHNEIWQTHLDRRENKIDPSMRKSHSDDNIIAAS